MYKWLLFCGAGAVVGYATVYFALDTKPTPQPEPAPPVVAATEPPVLSAVVDVTNLDSLLDARPAEEVGVPFEAGGPSELTAPPAAPAPIPMADEFDQQGAAPVVDPGRAVWFGGHRLPRQIGGGRPADELRRELAEWARVTPHGSQWGPSGYRPSGVHVGVGFYF